MECKRNSTRNHYTLVYALMDEKQMVMKRGSSNTVKWIKRVCWGDSNI